MTESITAELKSLPGFMIRRAHQVSAAILNAALDGLGITPSQFVVLSVIDAMPGHDQITVAGIAKLDRSTMTLVMRKLEQSGLVTRAQDPADRRRKTLSITALGGDVLGTAKKNSAQAKQRQLRPFGPGEADDLMRLLRRFVDTFEAELADADPHD